MTNVMAVLYLYNQNTYNVRFPCVSGVFVGLVSGVAKALENVRFKLTRVDDSDFCKTPEMLTEWNLVMYCDVYYNLMRFSSLRSVFTVKGYLLEAKTLMNLYNSFTEQNRKDIYNGFSSLNSGVLYGRLIVLCIQKRKSKKKKIIIMTL